MELEIYPSIMLEIISYQPKDNQYRFSNQQKIHKYKLKDYKYEHLYNEDDPSTHPGFLIAQLNNYITGDHLLLYNNLDEDGLVEYIILSEELKKFILEEKNTDRDINNFLLVLRGKINHLIIICLNNGIDPIIDKIDD